MSDSRSLFIVESYTETGPNQYTVELDWLEVMFTVVVLCVLMSLVCMGCIAYGMGAIQKQRVMVKAALRKSEDLIASKASKAIMLASTVQHKISHQLSQIDRYQTAPTNEINESNNARIHPAPESQIMEGRNRKLVRASESVFAQGKGASSSDLEDFKEGEKWANTAPDVVAHTDRSVSCMPGLVVKVEDAKRELLKLTSKDPAEQPTRYLIGENVPFAMISYQAILKNSREGLDALEQLLDTLQYDGYKFIWWDWLVIDANAEYLQANFEATMSWATESATRVAVCWPTSQDAYAYLGRPWCVAEIMCATKRNVHLIYCLEEEMNSFGDGSIGSDYLTSATCAKSCSRLPGNIMAIFGAVLTVEAWNPGSHTKYDTWRGFSLYVIYFILFRGIFFIIEKVTYTTRVLEEHGDFMTPARALNYICQAMNDQDKVPGLEDKLKKHQQILEELKTEENRREAEIEKSQEEWDKKMDARDEDEDEGAAVREQDEYDAQQSKLSHELDETREKITEELYTLQRTEEDLKTHTNRTASSTIVATLTQNGHLSGGIYDLSDAPSCASTMGIDAAYYTFEQASIKMSQNRAECGNLFQKCFRKAAFGQNHASWLDGESASGEWGKITALSADYCGKDMLCWTSPVDWRLHKQSLVKVDDDDSNCLRHDGVIFSFFRKIGAVQVASSNKVRLEKVLLTHTDPILLLLHFYCILWILCSHFYIEWILLVEDDSLLSSLLVQVAGFIIQGVLNLPYILMATGHLTFVGKTSTHKNLYVLFGFQYVYMHIAIVAALIHGYSFFPTAILQGMNFVITSIWYSEIVNKNFGTLMVNEFFGATVAAACAEGDLREAVTFAHSPFAGVRHVQERTIC